VGLIGQWPRCLRWTLCPGVYLCVFGLAASQKVHAASPSTKGNTALQQGKYSLPLSFEENRGQADAAVKYLGRAAGFSVAFREDGAEFLFAQRAAGRNSSIRAKQDGQVENALSDRVRMKLLDANQSPEIEGTDRLPGTVNYFIGSDPAMWRSNVPTFAEVRYARVYPGTDLIYYSEQQRLEFDFRLSPGADPRRIRMQFEGARELRIDASGNLTITMPGGAVEYRKPIIYQTAIDGSKQLIRGSFALAAHNIVRFRVGAYDRSRPLVIDPILNYSTYFGSYSGVNGVAVDAAGEAFVTGAAVALPATSGSFQAQNPNTSQLAGSAYVAKFNSTGTALLYCTYVGGSEYSESMAIALDNSGDAFITGSADPADFPITPGAFDTSNKNGGGSFVTELNSTGSALVYSAYLDGSNGAAAVAIALDTSGNAYVTGTTRSTDFPTTPGAFQQTGLASDSAFVTKLNPTGSALVYSTYLHGSTGESGTSIAVDSTGSAYVGGFTVSSDFPVTSGAFQTSFGGSGDGFLAKLNPAGSSLVYATYLGGSVVNGTTAINAVALDNSGNAYVTGNTNSNNFPITAGAFETQLYGHQDAFVAKFNSSGSALVYSSLLGSSFDAADDNNGAGIAVDSEGDALVVGTAWPSDFPITAGAFETVNLAYNYSGEVGSFVTKFNPSGSALLYSTYLSGSGDTSGEECDCANAVALDSSGNVYVGGITSSTDFPTTADAVQTSFEGPDIKGFVTEFNASEMTSLPYPVLSLASSSNPVEWGKPVTFTATLKSASGPTPTGVVVFSIEGLEAGDTGDGVGSGPGPWITIPLDPSGSATYTPAAIGTGAITVTAYYLGDANNAPLNNALTQTVTTIPTTTTLTSSANPAPYGTPVTFTATVLDNTGKPAQGAVDFGMGKRVYGNAVYLDANGQASWTNGTGGPPLPVGSDSVFAEFVIPMLGYGPSSATYSETFTPLGIVPSPGFSPTGGTYTSPQSVVLSDANTSSMIYYTTDGTNPTTNSNWYTVPILVSSSETVEAIAVAPGYSASAVSSAEYIIAPPPNFSLSGTAVTFAPGATTGNIAVITVTPSSEFIGSVSLNAVITASPPGSVYPPSLSFGTTSPVNVTNTNVGEATLTITTTAPTTSALAFPQWPISRWIPEGGAALACCLIFTRASKRAKWQTLIGFFVLFVVMTSAVLACGGGGGGNGGGNGGGGGQSNPGTTPGAYTITVTGISGTTQQTTTIALTVN